VAGREADPRRRRGGGPTARRRGARAVRHQQRLPTRAELHRQLAHCGITADDADLLRSADVAAGMLALGSSAVVLGGDGVLEALAARGVLVVPEAPADAVVVGLTRDFTYDSLTRAVTAVRAGARLVGTNEDATYPTPDGLVPGAGAILAAVETAAGTAADVAGKPHRPTADAITARVAPGELRVMVGDRPSTDGALAAQLGIPFGLVLSGVTKKGEVPPDADPAAVAPDLLRLVDQALGAPAAR
jgi:4-nitrophenyl phosphatase